MAEEETKQQIRCLCCGKMHEYVMIWGMKWVGCPEMPPDSFITDKALEKFARRPILIEEQKRINDFIEVVDAAVRRSGVSVPREVTDVARAALKDERLPGDD